MRSQRIPPCIRRKGKAAAALGFLLSSLALAAVAAALPSGCSGVGRSELILATTTSVQDSGLLEGLVSMFERGHPYSVKVVAVGSGAALEMARKGEADVLLVHSPEGEMELMRQGYGIERAAVMHNHFIVVGPPADPAGIRGASDAIDAFRRIAAGSHSFVSRGDGSGTHIKEMSVWSAAGISPSGSWYAESGKGMGDTLRVASEMEAYTLTDLGTWLSVREGLGLELIVRGGGALLNEYSVIVVNPDRWPAVNAEGARAFASFVTDSEARDLIRTFGADRFGEPLFVPGAYEKKGQHSYVLSAVR